MQTSKLKQRKHAAGQLLAPKQKAPHRTARHRKKNLLFSVELHQQRVSRLPSVPRAHPKKEIRKLLLKLVLQQSSQQVPALLALQRHVQLQPTQPVQRPHSKLQRTLPDPQQQNQLLPELLDLQRKSQLLMVRVQMQLNARSQDSVVAELLQQYSAKQAMLPYNERLLLVAHSRDPVRAQAALHLAYIVQVNTGLARGDALQAPLCANSPSVAFQ
jgi:hypothetical protein